MSIKSIKEKQLLVNLAKSFGQEIDPKLVNEVEKHKQVETNIRESIRSNVLNDLTKALLELKQEADRVSQENNYPLPPSLDDIEHLIEYEERADDLVQNAQETDTTETIADAVPDTESNSHTLQELAAEALSNLSKADSFQQPDPTLVDSDINSIRKKIKFLEQWISKVSMAGPGGGETKLRFLDDVDRDSIVNGYVLSYDEITNKFTFVSPTAGSFTPTDVKQVFAEVKNAESFPITIGQPVYLFAATGNRASVKLANNTGDPTSAKTLGLVYSASISPGGTGLVITQGVVTGVDTQAYSEGTTLYLGNTAGSLTAVKPYAPEHLVYIGVVERANQGQGQIYVRPQNGYELNEIHDVSINHTVPLSNNDIIVWNSASNVWVNRPISYLNQTTANIIENSNLYYTNARVYANVIQLGYATTDTTNTIANNLSVAWNTANSAYTKANTIPTQLVNGSDVLSLNGLNKVELPGGTAYIFSAANNITLAPDASGDNSFEIINNVGATLKTDNAFDIRTNTGGTEKVWTFTQGGSLFFPNGTFQTTAYSNSAVNAYVNTLGYATNSALSSYATTTNVALKANITDLTTANVAELTNLYYTNARVYSNVIGLLNDKVNVTDLPNANVFTATKLATARTINGTSFDGTANITITAAAGTLTGTSLNSSVLSSNLTSVGTLSTLSTSGTITANAATAFKAGSAAESGVALEIPREGGIRNMYNGDNTMYFDVSNGGSSHGHFSFRGSNAFTQYAKIDNSGIDAITSYKGKAPFNSALDTVVTVDNLKFRISNQGGVFPQVASASGSTVDVAYSAVGYINGTTNPATAHNSGYILLADGTWLSLYSAHGMDDRGDYIVFHIVDKNAGKIYRVTFMVTNNSSNTTGYNILVERII